MEEKDLELENISRNDKKVFLTLAADYANVGDIAITLAQRDILKKCFPDRELVQIPNIDFFKYEDLMKKIINDDDIITIIGGGNMGSVYPVGENGRRYIVENFSNNKIISFPQSIDFKDDENGKREFEKTRNTYNNNPNLIIFAREERSYNIMKNNFKNDVYLVPDTVLWFAGKMNFQANTRTNITFCFRHDSEKITETNILEEFENLLDTQYENINIVDTFLGDKISVTKHNQKEIFENILADFYNSKLVVTDRLHGMIFALITHTPCIAFDNSNHKISSTYNTWLKDIPFIKILDKYDENVILQTINEFSKIDTDSIQLNFDEKFEALFQVLK